MDPRWRPRGASRTDHALRASCSTARWAGCGANDPDNLGSCTCGDGTCGDGANTTMACAFDTDASYVSDLRRECISTARWVAPPYVFNANHRCSWGISTARWVARSLFRIWGFSTAGWVARSLLGIFGFSTAR